MAEAGEGEAEGAGEEECVKYFVTEGVTDPQHLPNAGKQLGIAQNAAVTPQ